MAYVSWPAKARKSQLEPVDIDWLIWYLQAGRGFGKTAAGAGTTIEKVKRGEIKRIALVAPTAADGRDIMVNEANRNDPKASGILPQSPPDFPANYLPSKRRIEWPNGAYALMFSAEDPDQLRGPEFDFAWCDELAAWPRGKREEAWSNLDFALRQGKAQRIVTTTPKPIALLKKIRAMPTTYITLGRTQDNIDNLSPAYIETVIKPYMGTRQGRQEIDGELLEENEAALFDLITIDNNRVETAPELEVINVAIDPTGSKEGHGCGIIVSGKGIDGDGYCLADRSLDNATPNQWALAALIAYDDYEANYIVVETNFGGDMVANTLRLVAQSQGRDCPPIKEVFASRGKVIRAEPISMLNQQSKIHIVGSMMRLEDQLVELESGETDDRADAFVWSFIDLLGKPFHRFSSDHYAPGTTLTTVGNIWGRKF